MPRRHAPARTAWLVYRFVFGAGIYVHATVFTLAMIDRLGAGPLTLALIGTTLEVCYTLAEVPTGVLADRYGRKRSMLVGLSGIAVAVALLAVPNLAVVLVADAVVGIAWTCLSGADVAWITDEVGEDAARPLYAAGKRAELLGSLAGIVAGVALGRVALWVPFVVAGALFAALAAWLALRMAETAPAHTHEDRLTLAETVRRTRASVRVRPWVGVALAVMVAVGLAGEGVDRLWQFHLFADDAGTDAAVVAVGVLFFVATVLGTASTAFVERRLRDDDPAVPGRWFGIANAATAVAVLLVAVGPWAVAAVAYCACQAFRHATEPLVTAWVNRGADARTRATLNSLVGQAESIGEVAGGPVLGGVGAAAGVPAALVTSAAVFGAGGVLTRWRAGALAATPVPAPVAAPSGGAGTR